jgi:hypothetical protein
MSITFKIASHDANEYQRYGEQGEVNAADALKRVWHPEGFKVKGERPRILTHHLERPVTDIPSELLQSSFRSSSSFNPNENGFVNTVVHAYNRHHHLIIR